MKTMAEIAASTATDKLAHGYYDAYDPMLVHLREQPVTIMEHGILGGDSLEVWAASFTHSDTRIWGVDVHDWGYRPKDPRIVLRFGSNIDPTFIRGTYAESGPLDFLCEDASHAASNQIEAFTLGWPFIKPGGIWVSEDQHTVHSPAHQDHDMSFIGFCARLATEMQDPAGADGCAAYNPLHPHSDIESIELRKGLAIIRKRT